MQQTDVWIREILPRLQEAQAHGCTVIHQTSDGGRLDLLALQQHAQQLGHRAGFYGRDLTIATERSTEPRKPLRGLQ